MDKKLRVHLEEHAKRIGSWMDWTLGEDFKGFAANSVFEEVTIPSNRKMVFKISDHAVIEFAGIQPSKIKDVKIGEAVLSNSSFQDLASFEITNASETQSLEQTYDFEVCEETFYSEEVAVGVLVGFRQMFTYGSTDTVGFEAETELTTEIETTWAKASGGSTSTTRATSSTFTVPPQKVANIVTERKIGKYERTDTFVSNLEYSVAIWSRGDYYIKWDSLSQLARVLAGNGTDAEGLGVEYRAEPMHPNEITWCTKCEDLSYDLTHTFEKSISGNVRLEEKNL